MHTLTWNNVNLLFMAFALIVSHILTQINPSKIWNHEWSILELSTAKEKNPTQMLKCDGIVCQFVHIMYAIIDNQETEFIYRF